MVCGCKFCTHESREIVDKQYVVDISKPKIRYHPDCFYKQNKIPKIIDVFYQNFNNDPKLCSPLRKILQDMIYKEGYDPDYIEFCLWQCVNNKVPLQHPGGVKLVTDYEWIKKRWREREASNNRARMKREQDKFIAGEQSLCEYKPSRRTGFADILGD